MNVPFFCPKHLFAKHLRMSRPFFLSGLILACAQTAMAGDYRIEWLERPWDLRYILYVTDQWSVSVENAREDAEKSGNSVLDRYWWKALFDPQVFFQSRDKWARVGDGLTAVVIEFEKDGKVKTPHGFGAPLYGRIDRLLGLYLAQGDFATQPRYSLGEWFMGLGDISTHWAPGLCDHKTIPGPFAKTDDLYLYGPAFKPTPSYMTVGCREWAYQLQNPNRPYIDITSYISKKHDPDGSGTYVRSIFGWSRFSDEPKPVIGKHEQDWYCFHECPGGDKPGLIPDIKAWAKRFDWHAPVPPTKAPTFPDPPAKSGTYPYEPKLLYAPASPPIQKRKKEQPALTRNQSPLSLSPNERHG